MIIIKLQLPIAEEVTNVSDTVQHATSYYAGECGGTKLAPTLYQYSDMAIYLLLFILLLLLY